MNISNLIRYEMVVNGKREMLAHPEGAFVKFEDVEELLQTSYNKPMVGEAPQIKPLRCIYQYCSQQVNDVCTGEACSSRTA